MDVVRNNYMPGDPRLIDQIVYELKSQGIFDQFRKECISDVDTKPAYQNLRQRVEGSVTNFLNKQCWRPDMNKNQVREQLRKTIYESGYLETGVERIVDQVVNPKINTVFLPKVEEIVYRFLGIEKPTISEQQKSPEKKTQKIDVADLLPTDLEAVSPESVNNDHNDLNDDFNTIDMKLDNLRDGSFNSFENNDSSSKADEDESPPFEPLDEPISTFVNQEENSVDSNLSGFSGLASHDSNHSFDTPKLKTNPTEQNNDSHMSQNSSEDRLSIVTSEGTNSKMEISEDSQEKEINNLNNCDKKIEAAKFDEEIELVKFNEVDYSPTKGKDENKKNDIKGDSEITKEHLFKVENYVEEQKNDENNKNEEKKMEENKDKKSRSSDKHKSSKRDKDKTDEKPKDKNDHKDKRSSTTSKDKDKDKTKESSSKSSRDKDYKSSSKHSSSSNKDKKDEKSSSSRDKDKDKREKDKAVKGKSGDKERSDKSSRDKDKSDNKEKRDKDKESKEKENKEKRDKEKTEKTSKDKERDRSVKENKDKDDKHKDKKSKSSSSNDNSVSSTKKELSGSSSSRKDKDKSRSNSSSQNKDKDKKERDKKSSSEKHKSHKEKDKDSRSVTSQNSSKHVTSKKDKEKDKDKKSSKDDHYSSKDKKRERRSTDRDSNDGSGKMSRNSSFTENSGTYSSEKKTKKENSCISGSGGDSSGNSDQNEKKDCGSETQKIETPMQVITAEVPEVMQKFKYIKPKFASNMKEAMKLMKIRKELAKLERQNQLALAEVKANNINMDTVDEIKLGVDNVTPVIMDNTPKQEEKIELVLPEKSQENLKAKPVIDEEPLLQSTDLSPERWEELEAKLAEEMSLINSKSYYGWDEDDIDMYEVEKDRSPQKITEDKDNKIDVKQEKSEGNEKKSEVIKDLDKDLAKDQSDSAKIHKENNILNISPDGQIKQIQKRRKLSGDKSVITSDKETIKKLDKSPSKKEGMSKCGKVTESKILNEELVISPKSKNKKRKISEGKNTIDKDNKLSTRSTELSSVGETEDTASIVKINERKQIMNEDFRAHTKKRDKDRKLSEDKTRIDNESKSLTKQEHKSETVKVGETKQNVKVILKNVIKNKDKQKRLSGDRHETDKAERKVTIKEKCNTKNVKVSDLKKSLKVLIEKKKVRGIGKPIKNGKKNDRTLVVHLEKLQGYNGQSFLRNTDICEEIQDKIEENDSSGEFLGFPIQGHNEIVFEEIITDTEDMSNNLILVEDENKIEENLVIEETVLMDENICPEIIDEDIILTEDGENILLGEESEIMLQKTEEENHIEEHNEVKVSEGPVLIVEDDGSLELSEEELEEIKNLAVNNKEGAIVCELELAYDNQIAQDQILFKVKDDKQTKNNGTLQELKIEFDPKNTCCQYLEKPSVQEEKKLQTIHEFIEKLEKNVEELSLKIHNNIPKVVNKVGRKRKVIDDAKNNNKVAKRSRQSSVNSEHLSKDKGQLCNTSSGTDISLNGSFSLPLSPADSDKDLDNKKDEANMSVETKRKFKRVPMQKRQCYTSDDLYKPRLVFSTSSRRSRGSKQSEN